MYIDGETLLFWVVVVVAISAFVGFERGKRRGREERDDEIKKQVEEDNLRRNLPSLIASLPEGLRSKFFAELERQKEAR